ncbi:hypothetical protein FA13DRAFT_1746236 [Coprinellus micaceus]|uniref:Uncharacterized protein n=1 Tax=Coprinellus micaceus TaxID=71717 RepID=A0A4Y7SAH8_COPMI|nr:hypothetical protein FA13DRAFT_1746236 [Coprinellus micaceus]
MAHSGDVLDSSSGTLIIVLGLTGAGKSHFINVARHRDPKKSRRKRAPSRATLAGEENPTVRHFIMNHRLGVPRDSPLILVDTPGLDHRRRSDHYILKRLDSWLERMCTNDTRLGGIVYLHDASDGRTLPHTSMLPLLSERRLAQRIVIVTSKWDRLSSRSTDFEAERKILEHTTFCKAIRQHGGQVCHFDNNPDSAWEVLDFLLGLGTVPLKLFQDDLKGKMMMRRTKSELTVGFRRWARGLFSRIFR